MILLRKESKKSRYQKTPKTLVLTKVLRGYYVCINCKLSIDFNGAEAGIYSRILDVVLSSVGMYYNLFFCMERVKF